MPLGHSRYGIVRAAEYKEIQIKRFNLFSRISFCKIKYEGVLPPVTDMSLGKINSIINCDKTGVCTPSITAIFRTLTTS